VRGEPVTFWYMNVDEAIKHRLKLEIDNRGLPFIWSEAIIMLI
jgi:hypothetical protein